MRLPSGETSTSRKQPSFVSSSTVSFQSPDGVYSAMQRDEPIFRNVRSACASETASV